MKQLLDWHPYWVSTQRYQSRLQGVWPKIYKVIWKDLKNLTLLRVNKRRAEKIQSP